LAGPAEVPPGTGAVVQPVWVPPLLIPAVPDGQPPLLVPGAIVLVDWAIAGIANATDIIAAALNPIRRIILCLLDMLLRPNGPLPFQVALSAITFAR
jgi:hypothetical protein